MNQKLNWARRRTNAAGVNIPVRFDSHAAGFEIKIKRSVGNKVLNLDPPLIPEIFDMRARVNGMAPLSLFKRGSAMASATLHETMLDERRLEAVLKMNRKKRC